MTIKNIGVALVKSLDKRIMRHNIMIIIGCVIMFVLILTSIEYVCVLFKNLTIGNLLGSVGSVIFLIVIIKSVEDEFDKRSTMKDYAKVIGCIQKLYTSIESVDEEIVNGKN